MPASEQLLDNLAGAVLDEAAVDWALAESSAGAAAQPLVRDLQLIASIASLFRDVTPRAPISAAGVTSGSSNASVKAHSAKCSVPGIRGSPAKSR